MELWEYREERGEAGCLLLGGMFLIVRGTVAWRGSQRRRSPLVEGDDGVYLGQAAEEWGRSSTSVVPGRAGHHRKCFCEEGLSYSSKNVLGESQRRQGKALWLVPGLKQHPP